MKNNSLTPSEEDYLEMIYRLSLNQEDIKVNDLSKSLNIKPPSVTKMIKKLDQKKVLMYKKYDSIHLTEIGTMIGRRLLDRHNIVQEFLKVIGVNECIHEETEKIEHTISIETLIKIDELINFLNKNEEILKEFREYQKKE
ncbi:Fur family transcriptional regulator [Romboutsia maritimum]|uniref:Manganese transport regulator n=2 Tax=Romboutsia maritimum TaxID=2020948 RepID=A0A371ITW6_9FIRM|nr:Fur family transcriptional regulator [Romboutsia maritimum]